MRNSLVCSYSRAITGWLANRFPGTVSLDSSGAGYEEIIGVFQLLLPAIEFQAVTQGEFSLAGRIKQLSGQGDRQRQLRWLLDVFMQSPLPEPVKDELYSRLKVFVKWTPHPDEVSPAIPLFGQMRGVASKKPASVHLRRIINQKITPPLRLSPGETTFLLDAMKLSLAMRHRETDPVTFADPEELALFEMGSGLHIAVVGMQKPKRLSLESYIGYMVFSNGMPVAYGGGWIWGQQCRIGISIYPEYRKAGSAWIFAQVLRLYYQYFNGRHFIIRANQFGKGNHDGLRSGAFWFYYKLGFRPRKESLRNLAGEEWKKIRADKLYRSSLEILRLFLTSPLEWNPEGTGIPPLEAETLSEMVTDTINREFQGSRKNAIQAAGIQFRSRRWQQTGFSQFGNDGQVTDNWSLLLNLLPGFREWNNDTRKHLAGLIKIKRSGRERDYVLGMQEFGEFWEAVRGSGVQGVQGSSGGSRSSRGSRESIGLGVEVFRG